MKIAAASLLALLLAGASARADAPLPTDRAFAAKASVSNTFEVSESKLALRRSGDPAVRAFARWMIEDHAMAQKTLDKAAGMSGTEAGPMLDPDHEAKVAALAGMSGPAFDTAYFADQLAAHQEAATMLEDYRAMGEDPALTAWAAETLPKVEMHLYHAGALARMAAPAM